MTARRSGSGEWVCYVLECADGTLYTGITNDLDRRLAAHAQGTAAKYTRGRQPIKLVYAEPHCGRGSASRREAEIKKLSRREKLTWIVRARRTPG